MDFNGRIEAVAVDVQNISRHSITPLSKR